jgi:hypothetical protein
VGGFDDRYGVSFDYLLWLRMAEKSAAIAIHSYLANFRRHAESVSETRSEIQIDEELAIALECGNAVHRLIHRCTLGLRRRVYRALARAGGQPQ